MRRPPPRRPWALPLVPLYGAAAALHSGLISPQSLNGFVLSVGSLSAGGAGKTPVVRMLAEALRDHGIAHDVLTRGYKRSGSQSEQVVLTGRDDAARFGDEPVELARAGVPVFVGGARLQAGRLAEAQAKGPLVHLLDDGFQHRRLRRDLDLVLLTQADADDWPLPAGNLREPLRALGRAEVVVLREEEADALEPIARRYTQAHLWRIRRELVFPETPVRKPFVFCGIARPAGFIDAVRRRYAVAGSLAFPDHHRYTAADIKRVATQASAAGADGFFTTEKDAVKLTGDLRDQLSAVGPTEPIPLRVSLAGDDAITWLVRQIREHQAHTQAHTAA